MTGMLSEQLDKGPPKVLSKVLSKVLPDLFHAGSSCV